MPTPLTRRAARFVVRHFIVFYIATASLFITWLLSCVALVVLGH